MAYKDILVYLDPTAESVERLRFSVDLAKTHGARLVGVDASALEGVAAADSSEVTGKMFDEATHEAGLKSVFVPAEKPGEGDAFTHCVDLIVAPAPGGSGAGGHPARRARPCAARIRRADADPAARTGRRDRSATTSSSPGTPGARRCGPCMTRCRFSRRRER